jgi:acetyltransferase
MLRHALASLFEPRSLLIIADRRLPGAETLPAGLRARTTFIDAAPGVAPEIPLQFAGLADDERPDLALLCVAPSVFAETLRRLAARAPRALIALPHEQADPYPRGTVALCQSWAEENRCKLLGPRAFGVQRPPAGLNFSQHPSLARSGRVALVAQSRSITAAVMDWAEDAHIGFSTAVALGDEAIVGLGPVLDYLATDPHTDSIALYQEDVGPARPFISALRAAASAKPVVVLKAGRGSDDDAVFDAVLRRAGAVRVRYFVQLFSSLKVLGYARRPRGSRVALFSNGSGPPQLALDLIGPDASVQRAELSRATIQAIEGMLEAGCAVENPVITHAPLTPDTAQAVLDALIEDPGVDGVLVLLAPDALADLPGVAQRLAQIAPLARKPIVSCFMGDAGMRPLRRMLDDAGTSAFRTPESAADAFGVLSTHFYNQQLLFQTQPPLPQGPLPAIDAAREIVASARRAGQRVLEPAQARDLLAAFMAPIHGAMPIGSTEPLSRPMAIRVHRDAHFGPVIRFGAGGPDAAFSGADPGMDLPPLNGFLARRLIERSSLWRKALATRLSSAAFEALQQALVCISELITDVPDVETLGIDPLYAGETRLYARSMRVALTAQPMADCPRLGGYPHMAIHPYPARLVQVRRFSDGQPWIARPIRPEDADSLQAFIRALSEQSRYMRFISMMRELTPRMLARYTQVDYDREVALVATTELPNPAHRGHRHDAVIGLAHYLRNPDGRGAEYALVVADAWQGRGLGRQLMTMLIDAAREQGLEYIEGLVLAENRPMLHLMSSLGLRNEPDPEDPALRRVWLDLGRPAVQAATGAAT